MVTGGAGFIGSNFIRLVLRETDYSVVNFDALTYAGNLENLADVSNNPRYRLIRASITDAKEVNSCVESGIDVIINFAAETHVDRSILDSRSFVETNVLGTQVLLDAARQHRVPVYLQISTDEVYGSLEIGSFTEESPLAPNSPYSSSKAGADLLVQAYHRTYGLDARITRCSNNYGPYQFPEKFIPLMILNALEGKPLPVYGDGLNVRDWIHVEDHCRALLQVLDHGKAGSVYNIGGGHEEPNIEVVHKILDILGRGTDLIQYVKDRPGHDRRYSVDSTKIHKELGWSPTVDFTEGLRETVNWYRTHQDWVSRVRSGSYLEYYQEMYDQRDQTLQNL